MVRASLFAALLLALAACSRDGALGPFAESQVPPALTPRFYPPEGWAWGFIGVGDKPVQRYGVGSTRRVPTATIVVVPGYGETAEMWFETAADLIDDGYTVWILDRAGQGGSGRYVAPRDLGHVSTFDPDIAALGEFVRVVVRPAPDTPLVLLSHADGVVVALSAVRAGMKVDGVIASSPNSPPSIQDDAYSAPSGVATHRHRVGHPGPGKPPTIGRPASPTTPGAARSDRPGAPPTPT